MTTYLPAKAAPVRRARAVRPSALSALTANIPTGPVVVARPASKPSIEAPALPAVEPGSFAAMVRAVEATQG
jgi:hypothetical protein